MRRVKDQDEEGKGPGDQEDPGTRGPRDQRTKGPEDQGTRGPGDQRTRGPKDQIVFPANLLGSHRGSALFCRTRWFCSHVV